MDRADRSWRVGRVAGVVVLGAGVAGSAALAVTVSLVVGAVAAIALPGVAVTAMCMVEAGAYRLLGRPARAAAGAMLSGAPALSD